MRKQIALCIGNDDYQYPCLPKLDCAVSDAASVSDKLKTLGFVSYQAEAYADNEYYVNKATEIGSIIARLKSHDWYTQNPAVTSRLILMPLAQQQS